MAQQIDCPAISWSLHSNGRGLAGKPRRAQCWGTAQGAGSFVRVPNYTQGASGNTSLICLAAAKMPAPADFEESHGVKDRRESGSQCSTSQPEARCQALRAITDALWETKGRPYREPGCVSNAVEKRNFTRTQLLEGKLEKAEEETVERGRRRRGRPSGICPWNKGVRMSASTRAKISSAQKARWRDPALNLHTQQSQKLKGKIPWNKGKSMSEETRQRMSAAKQFAVYPRSTTAKMSRSHVGLTHSPETCALISKRLTGRQKSREHRAAIAAGQRKRVAALKMINAVRAPQKECAPEELVPEPKPEPQTDPEPQAHTDMYTSGSVPHTRNKKKVHSLSQNEAVVEEFVGQLRQFRALQQDLAPWTEAFRTQHGRKPRVEDVELTGINWLIAKFKEYMRTRDHLLSESQQLRTKLESGGISSLGTNSYSEKMNANAGTGAMSKGAVRMAKALQYKRSKAVTETAAAPRSDWPEADSGTGAASGARDLQEVTAASLAGTATDAADQRGNGDPSNTAARTSTQAGLKARAEELAKKQTPQLEEVRNPEHLIGASARVKTAMLAAAQYKRKQAKALAAGVDKNSPI